MGQGLMVAAGTGTEWLSVAELLDMALPGLPVARPRLYDLIADQRWDERIDRAGQGLSRRRPGRGGATEYHVSLLPAAAALELVRRGLLSPASVDISDMDVTANAAPVSADWAWFDGQASTIKAEAEARLKIIAEIEALKGSKMSLSAAVKTVSMTSQVSKATLWNWLKLVEGCDRADRLPKLAPRRKGGGVEVEIDAELWAIFKSDFLRPSAPCYAECYRRLEAVVRERRLNVALPSVKTLQRKLEREVDKRVIIAKREGAKALMETLPAQKRTVAALSALELINIDGHKWDVFVRFPAKNGQPERVGRPIMVAMQDVYSRKMLAWRIDESESAVLTRLTFADLFAKWGIPKGVLMDNGRAFASKWISGGAKTRFRFKIREDEPLGLLTGLGVKIHWATPAHGQAKPIERAFRDLEEAIGKHPLCEGAYTGNHIDAKPENYNTKAIDLEVFERLVAAGIDAYNARLGRRTETANGRSFDAVFSESYAAQAIGRATAEVHRMALLTAEQVRCDKKSGAIELYGNRYWSYDMQALAGSRVMVRFDPDNLQNEIHVYRADGAFVATVPVMTATGFLDVQGAKDHAKRNAEYRKTIRKATELEGIISAHALAALMPFNPEDDVAPQPQPNVVRPVRHRGQTAAALKVVKAVSAAPVSDIGRAPVIDRFTAAVERMESAREERAKFTIFDGGLNPQQEPKRP